MISRRSLAILLTLCTLLVVFVAPAAAHVSWCSSDPVIALPDGSVINVIVEAPVEYIHSHVNVDVTAEHGARLTDVLAGDLVLAVAFDDHYQPAKIMVTAEPQGNFPLRVTVTRNGQVISFEEGNPGKTVRLNIHY